MANSGNTFLALVTGAAIGAAVGLLYAPESGEETRKKLNKESKKAQDRFNQKYSETTSNLSTKAKKAKMDFETRLEETLSSASHKADEILAAMESKLEDLRKQNAKLQKDGKKEDGKTSPNKAVV
ncbi:MAG: YtxH domain-containing protein [Gillisia sp.]